jgi:hypothetical protein
MKRPHPSSSSSIIIGCVVSVGFMTTGSVGLITTGVTGTVQSSSSLPKGSVSSVSTVSKGSMLSMSDGFPFWSGTTLS